MVERNIDDFIRNRKALEFLKVEYQVKKFIEDTLNIKLVGDVSEAAKCGITVEFLNVLKPPAVSYNKKPANNYQSIENIRFFNSICLDHSKFGTLFNDVDVVDTVNVTKSISMVQVLNNLFRIIRYSQANKITDAPFVDDADIPKFKETDIDRAVVILKEVAIEKRKSSRLALVAPLDKDVSSNPPSHEFSLSPLFSSGYDSFDFASDEEVKSAEEEEGPEKAREKKKDKDNDPPKHPDHCCYLIVFLVVCFLILIIWVNK